MFVCVGLAHLFFGVGLSGFSFGFQRVVFSSGGGRQNVLFSSIARSIYLFGFVWRAQLFVWLSQLLVLAAGGILLLGSWKLLGLLVGIPPCLMTTVLLLAKAKLAK